MGHPFSPAQACRPGPPGGGGGRAAPDRHAHSRANPGADPRTHPGAHAGPVALAANGGPRRGLFRPCFQQAAEGHRSPLGNRAGQRRHPHEGLRQLRDPGGRDHLPRQPLPGRRGLGNHPGQSHPADRGVGKAHPQPGRMVRRGLDGPGQPGALAGGAAPPDEHQARKAGRGRPGGGHLRHAGRPHLLPGHGGRREDPGSHRHRRAHQGQPDRGPQGPAAAVLRPGHLRGGGQARALRHPRLEPDRPEAAVLPGRQGPRGPSRLAGLRLFAAGGRRDRHDDHRRGKRRAVPGEAEHPRGRRQHRHRPQGQPLYLPVRQGQERQAGHREQRGDLQQLRLLRHEQRHHTVRGPERR